MRSRDKKTTTGDHAANGDRTAAGPGQPEPAPPAGSGNGRAPEPAPAAGPQHQAAVHPGRSHGLKNWRVRSRLLLLIAIPTITAVILGGIRINSSVQSALGYQRVLQLANTTSDITTLVQRLQNERDQTVYYIAEGPNGGRAAVATVPGKQGLGVVQQQISDANQSTVLVKADLNKVVTGSFSTLTKQEAAAALADLANLPNLREAATRSKLPALVVVQKYNDVISDLLVLEDATAQGSSDESLSQTVRVLGFVSRMKEDASQQRAILAAALIQGALEPASQAALVAAQSDQAANLSSFELSATNAQRTQFQNSVSGSLDPLASSEEAQALSLGTSLKNDPTTADDWYGAMSNEIDFQLGSVERGLTGAIIARTVALRNQAIAYALIVALIVLIVLGLALLATVVVARSMVRPLRRLRAGALEVAGVRLPETVRRMSEAEGAGAPLDVEPIDVDSTDEIGEVARAFDQVHREALRLASNEAALRGNVNAMFVNLSRRSQSLVERQIRLIDDLEQGEQDPERLANLFQMDHLATRMRRNSENLLVLAGHEVSRRWTQSVAAGGRAARGGVRDRAVRAGDAERPARHLGPRAGGQRRGPPDRRAGGERLLVLRRRHAGEGFRPPAQQRRCAARHHRPGRGHGSRGNGPRQLAAGQPARGGCRRVPAHGPVRGRPAGGPARHPGAAAARLGWRADRSGLAARRGDLA